MHGLSIDRILDPHLLVVNMNELDCMLCAHVIVHHGTVIRCVTASVLCPLHRNLDLMAHLWKTSAHQLVRIATHEEILCGLIDALDKRRPHSSHTAASTNTQCTEGSQALERFFSEIEDTSAVGKTDLQ